MYGGLQTEISVIVLLHVLRASLSLQLMALAIPEMWSHSSWSKISIPEAGWDKEEEVQD